MVGEGVECSSLGYGEVALGHAELEACVGHPRGSIQSTPGDTVLALSWRLGIGHRFGSWPHGGDS